MATFDAKKNSRFRELLNRPGLLRIPSCCDALSALIIQSLGFEMAYMNGSGTVASMIGKPDMGLATGSEMIEWARRIASAIEIPLVSDADTGYGNVNNVRQTIQGFEAAGVSGVHIEDQTMPKKLGSMAGITVIDSQEMVAKIRVACKSRKDPNFVVIGRTDSYAPLGIDEVIHRCKLYADAGADIIYAHNIIDRDHLCKLARSVQNVPLLYDVIEPKATYTDKELEEMGFKVVFHGRANILCQTQAITDLWTYYRDHGEMVGFLERLYNQDEWGNLIGNEAENTILDWIERN